MPGSNYLDWYTRNPSAQKQECLLSLVFCQFLFYFIGKTYWVNLKEYEIIDDNINYYPQTKYEKENIEKINYRIYDFNHSFAWEKSNVYSKNINY